MNEGILQVINAFSSQNILEGRKAILDLLVNYIKEKHSHDKTIRLNFICTHNSRRSHLGQIWAQTLAHYFNVKNVFCYSGGTEATAMYSKVVETIEQQGFEVIKLSEGSNAVHAIKYAASEQAIICFSKKYDDAFNPQKEFAAIMTCDSADDACPMVLGAEKRFAVKYEDPKRYDGLPEMDEKYKAKSLEIGQEMWYVFSQIH